MYVGMERRKQGGPGASAGEGGQKSLSGAEGAGLLGRAGTLRLVFPEATQEEANYLKFLEV